MSIDTKFQDKVVLLIEEDQDKRDKTRNFLIINKAAEVLSSSNFQDGYDSIPESGFDFCICDYKIFNTNAQNFIKILRREKKLDNDDQLIMADDFYEELDQYMEDRKKKKSKDGDTSKDFNEVMSEDIKKDLSGIHKSYCSIKSFLLVKSTNETAEAVILNIDAKDLSITLATTSMEEIDNYARQIKFESNIEDEIKSYTIIGDLQVMDESNEAIRELELAVPEQYSNILVEIEKDLFTAQEKTRNLLLAMKGELL